MDELYEGLAYVTFVFEDNSRQTIRTTLNKKILADYGIKPRENYLYDFSHAEYVRMREDACEVQVSAEKQEYEEALNQFANRFI